MTAETPALVTSAELVDFVSERHLATLTTLRRDFSPHVAAVGFTFDPVTRLARVITNGTSVKARNAGGSWNYRGATGPPCRRSTDAVG